MNRQTARVLARAPAPTKAVARILLNLTAGKFDIDRIFRDFVEMAALALANRCDPTQAEKREKRYLDIARVYTREEMTEFCHALAELSMGLDANRQCIFGSLVSALELHRHWAGQVFTPWAICEFMARMAFAPPDKLHEVLRENGFITFGEPCCGAASMIIAAAQVMQDEGFDPKTQLHVTCEDIDPRCAHMAFIQLSILGIPAHVICGNSLWPQPSDEHWFTHAHIHGCWGARLYPERLERALQSNDAELVQGARLVQAVLAGERDLTVPRRIEPPWRPGAVDFVFPAIA